MAPFRCHSDSDCNKTQIIRNFHLYVNSCGNLFSISLLTAAYLMLKLERYPPPKKSSRATLKPYRVGREVLLDLSKDAEII